MQALFERQQQFFWTRESVSVARRIEKLKALKLAVLEHQDALVEAMSKDFGDRALYDSLFGDVISTVNCLNYCRKKVKRWSKPEKRSAGLLLSPAKVRIEYQPLGVVGIVSPWNFPLMLSIGTLGYAISAGNCAMLKLSEMTPETNRVIRAILSAVFEECEVAVVEGDAKVAAEFSALPFNHLLFTGSTAVGKKVMEAASRNLTPITLELGGKSPVIIDSAMKMSEAVERMIMGKCLNAGQICIAPDYVFVPKSKVTEFVEAYQTKFSCLYPQPTGIDDYTAVVSDAHFERLNRLLADAEEKGATVVSVADGFDVGRKMSTKLVLNVDESMAVMHEEIFGPILPIVPYENLDEVIDTIRKGEQPLALYIMSHDYQFQRTVLSQTSSGGVGINEVVMHFAADDLPFGGVGHSGMGRYHGIEGFKTFSNARSVLQRGRFFNSGKVAHPPYGSFIQKILMKFFLR
jgi:coniferyl-aldehyde dehydrogenase